MARSNKAEAERRRRNLCPRCGARPRPERVYCSRCSNPAQHAVDAATGRARTAARKAVEAYEAARAATLRATGDALTIAERARVRAEAVLVAAIRERRQPMFADGLRYRVDAVGGLERQRVAYADPSWQRQREAI